MTPVGHLEREVREALLRHFRSISDVSFPFLSTSKKCNPSFFLVFLVVAVPKCCSCHQPRIPSPIPEAATHSSNAGFSYQAQKLFSVSDLRLSLVIRGCSHVTSAGEGAGVTKC